MVFADFSGEQVVQRHMSRLGRELLYHRIEAASTTMDRKALEVVLQEYGKSCLFDQTVHHRIWRKRHRHHNSMLWIRSFYLLQFSSQVSEQRLCTYFHTLQH